MAFYDPFIMKEIIKLTCKILQTNFYYDNDAICSFLDDITDEIAKGLAHYEREAEPCSLLELKKDKLARNHFSCYFTSECLRYVFLNHLHFTEQELVAFDSILPKYTGGNNHENRARFERKNH